MISFSEGDNVIHNVENEWFYSILVPLGFTPSTQTGSGFVRSYTLTHNDGRWVKCSIGVKSNNWLASDGSCGFESTLKSWATQEVNS